MTRRARFRWSLVTAALTFAGLVASPGAIGSDGDNGVPAHADDATIVHVLNRIAFGPRPGDVARVRQMGLAAYIDQQLHPERIDDSAVDAALAGFETLSMSNAELADRYFLPAQELRRSAQSNNGKPAPASS